MSVQKLAIDQIRRDGGTQPREFIDFETVAEYVEEMECGAAFPPVIVFHDGTNYWVADGYHRMFAAGDADLTEIDCDVRQGTQEDAQWYSFGANQTHGLRRTNNDKQRAVKAALAHPRCSGMSDHQIAAHCGVAVSTVGRWRVRDPSIAKLQMDERTVIRNGTAYQQNTSNIVRKRAALTVLGALLYTTRATRTLVGPDGLNGGIGAFAKKIGALLASVEANELLAVTPAEGHAEVA